MFASLCTFLPDAASKHAVQAFFDCLRAEVEEYGISVSTINHTFISSSSSEHTEASRSIWSCKWKPGKSSLFYDCRATSSIPTVCKWLPDDLINWLVEMELKRAKRGFQLLLWNIPVMLLFNCNNWFLPCITCY